jgi:hypothetical protein
MRGKLNRSTGRCEVHTSSQNFRLRDQGGVNNDTAIDTELHTLEHHLSEIKTPLPEQMALGGMMAAPGTPKDGALPVTVAAWATCVVGGGDHCLEHVPHAPDRVSSALANSKCWQQWRLPSRGFSRQFYSSSGVSKQVTAHAKSPSSYSVRDADGVESHVESGFFRQGKKVHPVFTTFKGLGEYFVSDPNAVFGSYPSDPAEIQDRSIKTTLFHSKVLLGCAGCIFLAGFLAPIPFLCGCDENIVFESGSICVFSGIVALLTATIYRAVHLPGLGCQAQFDHEFG